MASKHTPGPWRANNRDKTSKQGWEVLAENKAITGWGSVQTTEANARLIAAAPELLEALVFCRSVMLSNGVFETSERLVMKKAEAVLAKIQAP